MTTAEQPGRIDVERLQALRDAPISQSEPSLQAVTADLFRSEANIVLTQNMAQEINQRNAYLLTMPVRIQRQRDVQFEQVDITWEFGNAPVTVEAIMPQVRLTGDRATLLQRWLRGEAADTSTVARPTDADVSVATGALPAEQAFWRIFNFDQIAANQFELAVILTLPEVTSSLELRSDVTAVPSQNWLNTLGNQLRQLIGRQPEEYRATAQQSWTLPVTTVQGSSVDNLIEDEGLDDIPPA